MPFSRPLHYPTPSPLSSPFVGTSLSCNTSLGSTTPRLSSLELKSATLVELQIDDGHLGHQQSAQRDGQGPSPREKPTPRK